MNPFDCPSSPRAGEHPGDEPDRRRIRTCSQPAKATAAQVLAVYPDDASKLRAPFSQCS